MSVDTSNATATAGVDPSRVRIAGAIKQAADTTGTSFEYLLTTAKMESDFNPTAGASTSSAHGLFQFIDQTWLGTVKEAGAQLGYGKYADAITKSSSGSYSVSDPTARTAIMKLRDDPVASFGDGGRSDPVQQFQAHRQDRPPPDRRRTLYGALHGRRRRGQADHERRGQSAGLGRAAVSQRRRGEPFDLLRPHRARAQRLRSLFGADRRATPAPPVRRRRAPRWRRSAATPSAAAIASARRPRRSTMRPICRAFRMSARPRRSRSASASTPTDSPPTDPIFRSLFQAGDRTQPVSPAVHELWGNSSSLTSVASATPVAPATPVALQRRLHRQPAQRPPAPRSRSISSATAAARSAAD